MVRLVKDRLPLLMVESTYIARSPEVKLATCVVVPVSDVLQVAAMIWPGRAGNPSTIPPDDAERGLKMVLSDWFPYLSYGLPPNRILMEFLGRVYVMAVPPGVWPIL